MGCGSSLRSLLRPEALKKYTLAARTASHWAILSFADGRIVTLGAVLQGFGANSFL